jgi:hypothetical protein
VFYLAITMQGKLFFWPVRRPADDTRKVDKWMKAPLEAVQLARDKWTRIAWNEGKRAHDIFTCESTVEPEWPTLPLSKFLEVAFKDLVIDSLDHLVVRRLQPRKK